MMAWLRRLVTMAAGSALLAGCVYGEAMDEVSRADLPPLAADRAEPRLALAEHLLAGYFTADIVAPPTVCLAISEGRQPDGLPPGQETALIARFARLAPFARCGWQEGAWRDVASEEPALVFTIHSFECSSDVACQAWAGYTAGATSSSSALYRMAYADGRWTFERDRRLIME